MKKLFKKTTVLLAFTGLVTFSNCGKKDTDPSPENCGMNAEKVLEAANTFGTNPSKTTCEAYKKTLEAFYKSCPTFYTGVTKQQFDEFLAEPCDF
ncbi:hypothetical protein [Arundinibacter roseus]|uniref:Uncharacterized protein n=1 Tax=Arundinibacter roseus TaxID=2070510 RepID=A0A4R4KDV2_9BACT|nr:hypothetical protein [Arundinibacter roseus]TDB64579.1 hypothetical protein EZE20_12985 [Arundinibacter roseus]